MDDPIIITGFQRSGTTALAYALHKIFPNIINESGIMKTALDHLMALDNKLEEHVAWRYDITWELFNDTHISDFIKNLYMRLISSGAHIKHFTKDYADDSKTTILDESLKVPGKYDFWGDKITNTGYWIPIITEIFPEAKIIYVVREPLECIASNLRLGWAKDKETAWGLWMSEMVEYNKWREKIPHLIVRQKELLDSPQKVATDMTQFLDFKFLGSDFGSFIYKGDKPERKTTNPEDYSIDVPSEMMGMVQLARSM